MKHFCFCALLLSAAISEAANVRVMNVGTIHVTGATNSCTAPAITAGPASTTNGVGSNVVFSVTATVKASTL